MTPEEMLGARQAGLLPEDARQALLCLAIGSHWDVYNLAIIMAFSEKLNVSVIKSSYYQIMSFNFLETTRYPHITNFFKYHDFIFLIVFVLYMFLCNS